MGFFVLVWGLETKLDGLFIISGAFPNIKNEIGFSNCSTHHFQYGTQKLPSSRSLSIPITN